jgi:hypothetical protein
MNTTATASFTVTALTVRFMGAGGRSARNRA